MKTIKLRLHSYLLGVFIIYQKLVRGDEIQTTHTPDDYGSIRCMFSLPFAHALSVYSAVMGYS